MKLTSAEHTFIHTASVAAAATAASPIPLVAYPNSGATYDATTKVWTHSHAVDEVFSNEALKWHGSGCKWIGGCCCTSAKEISLLKETFSAIL